MAIRDLIDRAELYEAQGDHERADRLLEEALQLTDRQNAPGRFAELLDRRAALASQAGDLDLAEALYRESIQIRRNRLGAEHPTTDASIERVVDLLHLKGELGDGQEVLEAALERARGGDPQAGDEALLTLKLLATRQVERQDLSAAQSTFERLLNLQRQMHGASHVDVANTLERMAALQAMQGRIGTAIERYGEALEMRRELHGDLHPRTGWLMVRLARLHHRQADTERAAGLFEGGLERLAAGLPSSSHLLALPRLEYGLFLTQTGSAAAAEELLRDTLSSLHQSYGAGHSQTAKAEVALGACLAELGLVEEARLLLERGWQRLRRGRNEPWLERAEAGLQRLAEPEGRASSTTGR